MKHRVEVGLLVLLFLFFISINDPLVYIGGLLRRVPANVGLDTQYTCVAQRVPEDAHLLFFSNLDGSMDWNTYNYQVTMAAYGLVPRIVEYNQYGPSDLSKFKWFLVWGMDAEKLDNLTRTLHLQVVQTCNRIVLLTRSN